MMTPEQKAEWFNQFVEAIATRTAVIVLAHMGEKPPATIATEPAPAPTSNVIEHPAKGGATATQIEKLAGIKATNKLKAQLGVICGWPANVPITEDTLAKLTFAEAKEALDWVFGVLLKSGGSKGSSASTGGRW